MRLLLDTHIALWAIVDSPKLSATARALDSLHSEIAAMPRLRVLAAGKAAGSGLSTGAERPRIAAIDPDGGMIAVTVRARRIEVVTRRDEDVIVATAQWPAGEGGAA